MSKNQERRNFCRNTAHEVASRKALRDIKLAGTITRTKKSKGTIVPK